MFQVSYRQPVLADCEALHQLCWPHKTRAYVEKLIQRTLQLQQRQRGGGYVAIVNQRACGFGLLTIWPKVAEISDLIVAEAHRSQGIGSGLIHELMRLADDYNANLVEIGVVESNHRAKALYERLGFVFHRQIVLRDPPDPEVVFYLRCSSQPNQTGGQG